MFTLFAMRRQRLPRQLLLIVEALEQRLVLSASTFVINQISSGTEHALDHADIDRDGDVDLIVYDSESQSIRWLPNNGQGSFGDAQPIASGIDRLPSIDLADVDGDDDLDVLLADFPDVKWLANDGQGSFSKDAIVATGLVGDGLAIVAADVDGDDDLDVVVSSYSAFSDRVSWIENENGEFSNDTLLSEDHLWVQEIQMDDVDGDGDIDLVLVGKYSPTGVSWSENDNGTFEPLESITMETGASDVGVADIDGDGDKDVVAATYAGLMWFEQEAATFVTEHVVDNNLSRNEWFSDVQITDIDGDGDYDLIASTTSESSTHGGIKLYQNQGGIFHLEGTIAFDSSEAHRGFAFVDVLDMDNDQDMDVITSVATIESNLILWYENRIIGDSTDDGVFDSQDLVKVFQSGKYEDEVDGNATFDEGDWNGDGDFNSGDIVYAFQAGTFAAATKPADLAAAVDAIFLDDDD